MICKFLELPFETIWFCEVDFLFDVVYKLLVIVVFWLWVYPDNLLFS